MPEYPPYPFVVRHIRLNRVGVAFKARMVRGYPYFSVSCIQAQDEDVSTWAAWSQSIVVLVPDLSPESLGWKPRVKVDMYLRNSLTGAVARAYSDTYQNRVPAWGVERPDGSKTSRWLKKYSVEITRAEYDAADKTIMGLSQKTGPVMPRPKQKGSGRICRKDHGGCGKEIIGPNMRLCPGCHRKLMLKIAGRSFSQANSAYPADVLPGAVSEI